MKRFAVLVAALAIAYPAVMASGMVYADEIVVTPEQWGAATSPAAPGQWRHVGTSGYLSGETAPAKEEKEPATAKKEAKEPAAKKTSTRSATTTKKSTTTKSASKKTDAKKK